MAARETTRWLEVDEIRRGNTGGVVKLVGHAKRVADEESIKSGGDELAVSAVS
jgi:hypothetical protein